MRITDVKEIPRASDFQFHIQMSEDELKDLIKWNRGQSNLHCITDSPPQRLISLMVSLLPRDLER